ncbi:MAG: ATP-binding protein [Bacteroidetes bacterium]|nr:MAG: ATP-binding protein [Bacteroidota bacterium]
MFKRALSQVILPQLQHKNAIVITGMRQVGKTTLMRQLADQWPGKHLWFDFDNPLDMLVFENIDYNVIYRDLQREAGAGEEERFLVCIDELQNYPEITKIIKYLIDHYGLKFILTGSSNYYLRNLFPESLSGRKFLYVLHPLSYREYLYFHGALPENQLLPNPDEAFGNHSQASIHKRAGYYEAYLTYGGFPEVALTQDSATKKLVLKNIFASFFEKDIKVFSELKDVRELRDLILLLASRNGNIIDVTRLASELGVNRVKIYNYLEFLEGTFFLRLLPRYSGSIDRSVAGGKKVYFSDTGLLNLLRSIDSGQLLETAVANQLQHYGDLAFYNKKNTAEIDFILNGELAIEVKHKAIEPDLRKLEKIAHARGIKKYFIASKTPVNLKHVIYPWYL